MCECVPLYYPYPRVHSKHGQYNYITLQDHMYTKVRPSRGVSMMVRPSRGVSMMVRPSRDVSMMVRPSRGVSMMVRPSRGVSMMVRPSRGVSMMVRPSRDVSMMVRPQGVECVVYTYAPLENLKVISYEHIIIPINKITPLHIISLHELKHLTIHSSMCSQ